LRKLKWEQGELEERLQANLIEQAQLTSDTGGGADEPAAPRP
jgi:hypothetical protein